VVPEYVTGVLRIKIFLHNEFQSYRQVSFFYRPTVYEVLNEGTDAKDLFNSI